MLDDAPVLAISQAAVLAGMHPQTLRQYDRLGLVVPQRSSGRGRRYSMRDIATLLKIQRLSQVEGINLAGIQHILSLESKVESLEAEVAVLSARIEAQGRVFAAGLSGEMVVMPRGRRARVAPVDARAAGAVVLWRPISAPKPGYTTP